MFFVQFIHFTQGVFLPNYISSKVAKFKGTKDISD